MPVSSSHCPSRAVCPVTSPLTSSVVSNPCPKDTVQSSCSFGVGAIPPIVETVFSCCTVLGEVRGSPDHCGSWWYTLCLYSGPLLFFVFSSLGGLSESTSLRPFCPQCSLTGQRQHCTLSRSSSPSIPFSLRLWCLFGEMHSFLSGIPREWEW